MTTTKTNIAEERYIACTTFKKDGTPKPSPVWPVDVGGHQIGFITSSTSWKIKRLRNNNRVDLQPSDYRGNPTEGSRTVSGTAVVVEGPAFAEVNTAVSKKYGVQLKIINFLHFLPGLIGKDGHKSDCAVIITLD